MPGCPLRHPSPAFYARARRGRDHLDPGLALMMRRSLGRRRSMRIDAMVADAAGPLQVDPGYTSLAIETVAAPPIVGAPRHGSLPYLPGLDGLRALAVLAVLLFHGRSSLLPGGFLGVDIFFVISGFIITRLLLNEWQTTGRINLGSFWWRRAKRLDEPQRKIFPSAPARDGHRASRPFHCS